MAAGRASGRRLGPGRLAALALLLASLLQALTTVGAPGASGSNGGLFNYGDAGFFGSIGNVTLNRPIVGMAPSPDSNGYWFVASDGGIFTYGDAGFYGSTGGMVLNRPVVGMAATPDGRGYWLVASDGGIFSYGDAVFHGSTGSLVLNRPVVGMAATPDGRGYWLVASDGGIFTYGDAGFYGSAGGSVASPDIVGMAATRDGRGYWMVASAGSLTPPPGYAPQQLLFEDQFGGTSLDTSKWSTALGAEGVTWNDAGNLPSPFTATNTVANGGTGFDAAMYSPSQVSVDNGLVLTAQHNPTQYASTYPWLSGVVTTEGKFSLPAGGWYVQVKAKMPDQSQGMWPAIWFIPGSAGTPVNEFDGYEGGWPGPLPNDIMHSGYFAGRGQQQRAFSVNADVTAGYHLYGFQYIPGQSVTTYFDGQEVWQLTASSNAIIPAEPYEILLQLEVASPWTAGWHLVPTPSTPSASMEVAEVQAYS